MFLQVSDLDASGPPTQNWSGNQFLVHQVNFQAWRNELEAYKEALDGNTIVSMTNATGRITDANEDLCKIGGYPRDEIVGMKISMLISGFHSREFKEGASFGQLLRIAIENGQYLDLHNDPHP